MGVLNRGCTFKKGDKVNKNVTFEPRNKGGQGPTQPHRYLGKGSSIQRESQYKAMCA